MRPVGVLRVRIKYFPLNNFPIVQRIFCIGTRCKLSAHRNLNTGFFNLLTLLMFLHESFCSEIRSGCSVPYLFLTPLNPLKGTFGNADFLGNADDADDADFFERE